ncbi:MAG: hypothetical protein JRD93_06620 [Deltaproteobacteria bacterium]|nr:hypothetical protein [Deltaproteobacteria bacterium]
MTLDEIKAQLKVGYTHEVCPDSLWFPDYPGYVRKVFIRQGYLVSVEYELYNMDEGGAYFQAKFFSLEDAVKCVERYIGKRRVEWKNEAYKDHSLDVPQKVEFSLGHKRLAEAIRHKSIKLPSVGEFELVSTYWKQFENEKE